MNKPKVTIGIPTYNRKDYIIETLDSVFSQTFTDFEVIVVDDGSTDGTKEVIQNYGQDIRYYWKENGGDASARNKIIDLAEGDYITFIDSDDVLFPYSIKHLYEKIIVNGGNCISYGNYIRIDENGEKIGYTKKKLYSGNITEYLFKNIFVNSCGSMFPLNAVKDTEGFTENLVVCSDYKKWLELSLQYKFYHLEGPSFLRRRHSSNISVVEFDKELIQLSILENFYKENSDILNKNIAFKRLSSECCRIAKVAKKENLINETKEYYKKSLRYRFNIKAFVKLFLNS